MKKAWIGYSLFALLAAACALYILFPSMEIVGYVDQVVKGVQPNLSFTAAGLKPWPPLRFRLKELRVTEEQTAAPLFSASTLVIGPRVRSLLHGKLIYGLEGTAYKGSFAGSFRLPPDNTRLQEVHLVLHDVDLERYVFLSELAGRKLGGILTGSVALQSDDQLLSGTGQATISVTAGRVELLQSFFGLQDIPFKDLTIEAQLAGGRMAVNFVLKGPELQGNMSGTVTLLPDLRRSRLNFRGEVEPLSQLIQNYPQAVETLKLLKNKMKNGRFSFAILGTMQNPIFRFI
jgi:type II secretion system protein N